MRHLLGVMGGVLLALVLFTLLGLLVTPPEDERQVVEMPVAVSMVEAVEQQASQPAAAATDSVPTPPSATPPPPAPVPSPAMASDIAMPEPDVVPDESPEMPQEMTLPELAQVEPEPTPQPPSEAQPQPQPEPTAEPARESPAEPAPQAMDAASGPASEAPAANAVESGSPQPTRRIPPEYPSRAQRRGLEGYVEVRFTIRPDGSVDSGSLRVVDARPRNVFERAAMQAISRWQFPESQGPREARQRLEFKLEG